MQEYDPISVPIGFHFKFNFYSTHGDPYYIGLNGIEMYDQTGREVLYETSSNKINNQMTIQACPSGVHAI